MAFTCYWLEKTERWRESLTIEPPCNHRSVVDLGDGEGPDGTSWENMPWPETCPVCNVAVDYGEDGPLWRHSTRSPYYRRADTGEERVMGDWEPGAMWDEPNYHDWMVGVDGRSICVKLPNGHSFTIDGRASNCTRPDEECECWCRHGEPPNITVDKEPNPGRQTCTEGAGSIWSMKDSPDSWHGFLRGGQLLECGVDGV